MNTEGKKYLSIKSTDGTTTEVELLTYLVSDDQVNTYVVYSKGEISGAENDEVIYISKMVGSGDNLLIEEITDENEWSNVLQLLKKIANA